jgi:epoxyqueuosine reductase
VLGTLVTSAEVEPSPPLDADCGSCRICIDACPTDALEQAGVLDGNRCLSWTTQRPGSIPHEHRAAIGDAVYGCDICQAVCPWNRGVERRRADVPPAGEPTVDLVAWLEADGSELLEQYERLYVPRRNPRYLKRNALVALGNSGGPEHAAAIEPFLADEDPLLREHAEWALARLHERHPG